MYSLLPVEKKRLFYDILCDDTIGHIIGFLEDEEKVEWCHVHPVLFSQIRTHSPEALICICSRCTYHLKRCICKKRDLLIASVILFLVFLLMLGFMILIMWYVTS